MTYILNKCFCGGPFFVEAPGQLPSPKSGAGYHVCVHIIMGKSLPKTRKE